MTVFYADISKLTDNDLRILKKSSEGDTVVFFHGENASIPVGLHETLSELKTGKHYFTAETDVEKSFYAGIMYGRNEGGKNVFLSGVELPVRFSTEIKKIAPQETAQKPKTEKKKAAVRKKAEKAEKPAEPEPEKEDPEPVMEEKKSPPKQKRSPKPKTEPKQPQGAENDKTASEQKPVEQKEKKTVPETKKDIWSRPAQKVSPWTTESSRAFFSDSCGLPKDYENHDELVEKIGLILYEEEDVNKGLARVKKECGAEIEKYIEKRINISVSSIKDGFKKKVDEIVCL